MDHCDVLVRPSGSALGEGRCDAVIVPTHDAALGLDVALDLAARLSCTLLVMCSQGRESTVEAALRRPRGPRNRWSVALPHGGPQPDAGSRPVPQFAAWDQPGALAIKYRDLALKRCTALALGRLLGWRTVLFLDDDIRKLTAADVETAARELGRRGAAVASWRIVDYPDNSAVCHAGRLAGNDQKVFVGSGAMLVRLDAYSSLFPPVYNEDWCFMFDALAKRQVLWIGDVEQLAYDPFDPVANRGGNEEFGDVLGEGLFHLLHHGYGVEPAMEESYWPEVVAARRKFILEIRDGIPSGADLGAPDSPDERRRRAALACLTQALRQHRQGLPRALASFVRAWRADQTRWQPWFEDLPGLHGDVEEAVRMLGWPPEHFRRVEPP